MVNVDVDNLRCRQCEEINPHEFKGFVYCRWLKCEVYMDSLMCEHGRNLAECF